MRTYYGFNPCWVEFASADNAAVTASRAGIAKKSHMIVAVLASFSGATTKLLQIKDGTTVIAEHYIVNSGVIPFPQPLACTEGNETMATLEASGTAGVVGKVVLVGFTSD